jgi:hypothetical protein
MLSSNNIFPGARPAHRRAHPDMIMVAITYLLR